MARKLDVQGGSQKALRSQNERRVLDALASGGDLTQAQISRETALAASTVSNIVNALVKDGVVERKQNLGGPHGQLIGIVPAPGTVVGIDLGKRHLRVCLSNLAHEIIAEAGTDLPSDHGVQDDLNTIDKALDKVTKEAGIERSDIRSIGLAIPAPIDLNQRRITSSQVMPTWSGIDIPELFQEHFGIDTFVDNDANLGAIGERVWGAAHGFDDITYIKVADGIGAGIILGGQIYRGADGSAGEIGHITIDERGDMCRCGNRGCLETVASVPSILTLAKPIFPEGSTITDIIDSAKQGNTGAMRLLEDTGRQLGIALANMVNTLNPRIVVLGGSLSTAGDLIIEPVRRILKRNAVHGVVRNLEFKGAELGEKSSVLGAVSLALTHTPQI
ncbi:MAG: ROK family transcriptional regulator [Actinomycetaceae bacterium]|nr:ROK family transcriptional regulator [Actinomycetaceae bacterium]